jgi:hypothetical protein
MTYNPRSGIVSSLHNASDKLLLNDMFGTSLEAALFNLRAMIGTSLMAAMLLCHYSAMHNADSTLLSMIRTLLKAAPLCLLFFFFFFIIDGLISG